MSDNANTPETVEEQQEAQQPQRKKTKYDEKMERRAAQKKKEKRDETVFTVCGIAIILLLVAFIAYFPIRSFVTLNKSVCTVAGEKVTRVEFDYYYNNIKNNYLDSYSSYLSYFGISDASDVDTASYDGTLTFKDYFEEQTIQQIRQSRGLLAELTAAGFSTDTESEYKEYLENLRDAVKQANVSEKEFYQTNFGEFATESRLEPIVKESILVNAYYEEKIKEFLPSDDEVNTYYEENKADYDVVTYRLLSVEAELPTEPTELADEGAAVDESGNYTPNDAEVAAAMEVAKAEAEEAEKTVATEGELHEKEKSSAASYYTREWLFDEARQAGDTAVLENTVSNLYYVVEFESRIRDDAPTYDFRMIVTQQDNGEAIKQEFAGAGASEDAFLDLVEKYSVDKNTEGGLYEGQDASMINEEIDAWLSDASRKTGDVESFYQAEGGVTYVFYFVAPNKPRWFLDIRNMKQNDQASEYLQQVADSVDFADPEGNLAFVALRAQQEADAAAEGAE